MSLSKEIYSTDLIFETDTNDSYSELNNIENDNNSINSIKKLLNFIDISFNNLVELIGLKIERDSLLRHDIVNYYNTQQEYIKSNGYRSSKLTSLHENNKMKQSFPAVNMLRQLLKCNGYYLKPYVRSIGYDNVKGYKKVKRYYIIEKKNT